MKSNLSQQLGWPRLVHLLSAFFAITFLVSPFSSASFRSLEWKGVDPQDKIFGNEVLKTTLDSIPKKISSIPEFQDLSIRLADFTNRHMGKLQGDTILISRNLFQKARLNPTQPPGDQFSIKHSTYRRLLQATIVHEIGHFYDLKNIQSTEVRKKQKSCRIKYSPRPRGNTPPLSPECAELVSLNTTISSDPAFLSAVDFRKVGFTEDRTLRRMNFLEKRSLDPYEWNNPQESFAVNLEYFLLDPEFACRKPILYKYFTEKLNHIPFSKSGATACSPTSTVLVSGGPSKNFSGDLRRVDSSRVYQVDYLFAGRGKEAMSKYGHSMIRLVVCSEDRQNIGPECLEDVNSHLVVSFRASVEDLAIDTVKGLTGKYPSIAFIFPFLDVVNEYTKLELRDLTALPLKLSEIEIHNFVTALVETHWTYQGKYKFLSNNCADETLALFKKAFPNRKNLQYLSVARPDTLFSKLVDIGLGNATQIVSKPQAQITGHYFPSRLPTYQRAIGQLVKQGLVPSNTELEGYLAMSAEQRQALILKLNPLNDERVKPLVSSALLLEDLAFRRVWSKLTKDTIDTLIQSKNSSQQLSDKGNGADSDIREAIDKANSLSTLLRSPSDLLDSNTYGIPIGEEVDGAARQLIVLDPTEEATQLQDSIERLIYQVGDPLPVQELKNIRTNYSILMQYLGSIQRRLDKPN